MDPQALFAAAMESGILGQQQIVEVKGLSYWGSVWLRFLTNALKQAMTNLLETALSVRCFTAVCSLG